MLVYAVKNKDGKYDMDCCDVNGNELFSLDISMCNWLYSEEDAKEFLYGDRCEIVPVTICEGDLEKDIIDLKRQIERLKIEKDDLEDLVDKIRDNDPMIKNLKAQIEILEGQLRQYKLETEGVYDTVISPCYKKSPEEEQKQEYFNSYICKDEKYIYKDKNKNEQSKESMK